jgi:hypothetical protein
MWGTVSEHAEPQVVRPVQLVDGFGDSPGDRRVERVAGARAVDGDDLDRVTALHEDLVRHCSSSMLSTRH